MEAKTVRPQAHSIQKRFFEALDLLIESGHIKSLQSFCKKYDLHRPKYSNIRTYTYDNSKKGTGYKLIDVDALSYLLDYEISADWLLSGKGGMFRK